jgi:hypothetical protein
MEALTDPFRESLLAAEALLPEQLRQDVEPVRGEPACDPEEAERLAAQIALPDVRFEHPLLARAVRIGLAHIDLTFQGDHPKYGVGCYAQPQHDGFPPTIIAAVDALTLWGKLERAERLFGYWLHHFVRDDGTIRYYGPSLSEYGQLLTTARRLMARGGAAEWLRDQETPLSRLSVFLLAGMREGGQIGLLKGVPEADESARPATYFHNNAWVIRGLEDWAKVLKLRLGRETEAQRIRQDTVRLRRILREAVESVWPQDAQDWWLRPMAEAEGEGEWGRPEGRVTANRLGSYTNYRYWPELLSSRVLPPEWNRRLVRARLYGGGQFCGVTRFADHLDDWPLKEYLDGLWQLGMREDYRLSLWGHLRCHQAEGHLTAYEQVSLPPGRRVADYCLPCQLVVARAVHRCLWSQ